MKKATLPSVVTAVILLLSWPLTGYPDSPVTVDILYMNHGPLRPTVEQVRQILSGYGDQVKASWYDFESKEGEKFMAQKGIRQHIPLMIWLNGKPTVPLEGKEIQLMGFPSGSGPAPFQGKWAMEDFRRALDQLTGKK